MWQELSTGIKAIVVQCTKIDSAYVYEYAKNNINGYPAVTITPSDGDGDFADTRRNKRTYTFSVRVHQERTKAGDEKSERIMREIVDDLIELFDANYYLDGARLQGRGFARPIPSTWAFVQTEQSDVRVAEILIACSVIQ